MEIRFGEFPLQLAMCTSDTPRVIRKENNKNKTEVHENGN
jgi:hypothetical protein